MHIKAKTLHIFYAKKLKIVQNQEKSLWCILKQHSTKSYQHIANVVTGVFYASGFFLITSEKQRRQL